MEKKVYNYAITFFLFILKFFSLDLLYKGYHNQRQYPPCVVLFHHLYASGRDAVSGELSCRSSPMSVL